MDSSRSRKIKDACKTLLVKLKKDREAEIKNAIEKNWAKIPREKIIYQEFYERRTTN